MNDYKGKVSTINESANIWMHRCNHYGDAAWKMLGYDYESKNFSDENGCYISVGCDSGKWSIEEYNSIKISEDKWKEFEKHYSGSKPRYRHFLYKFFFEFRENDYIVVPSGGEFHVFQIESDEMLTYDDKFVKERLEKIHLSPEEIGNHDFKFFKKVKPIRVQIPRKGYAVGELCSKLKYQGTTLEIKDNAAKILKEALEADGPFSIYGRSIEFLKKNLYDNALCQITPDNFESLIAWYFKKKGADVHEVLKKNYSEKVEQEDVDVLAIYEDLKIRFFVQAKAYNNKNGKKVNLGGAINQLNKYMNHHVSESDEKYTDVKWIVCLAKTNEGIEKYDEIIKDNNSKDIRIINGMEFAEMLLDAGIQNIDEALNNTI